MQGSGTKGVRYNYTGIRSKRTLLSRIGIHNTHERTHTYTIISSILLVVVVLYVSFYHTWDHQWIHTKKSFLINSSISLLTNYYIHLYYSGNILINNSATYIHYYYSIIEERRWLYIYKHYRGILYIHCTCESLLPTSLDQNHQQSTNIITVQQRVHT